MIYSTMVNRVMIGVFSYWIGFSFRNIGTYWAIDLGYLKFMIAKGRD